MVEHPWVRIAEIKEEAADEEWVARNPRLAKLRGQLRYARVQYLLLRKRWAEDERVIAWAALSRLRMLGCYLATTRLFGCRPRRKHCAQLSTRELISEMEARRCDHSDCIERTDLLDALCGPPDAAAEDGDPLLDRYDDDDVGDKMV